MNEIWAARGRRGSQFAGVALLLVASGGCAPAAPDPLLAPGEHAIVGSYRLDNVLLAPGKLVLLPNGDPLFAGMGATLDQASRTGWLSSSQAAVLKKQDCTLTVLADHTFFLTNFPSPDLSQALRLTGTWSMQVYHVFDTYGYRITVKSRASSGPALDVKFFNADKPNPRILEIFYRDGKKDPVIFRFGCSHSED